MLRQGFILLRLTRFRALERAQDTTKSPRKGAFCLPPSGIEYPRNTDGGMT